MIREMQSRLTNLFREAQAHRIGGNVKAAERCEQQMAVVSAALQASAIAGAMK